MGKYNFEQKRNDYETPPELVKMALDIVDADKFDCDVCASRPNIPARTFYTIDCLFSDCENELLPYDGLTGEWGLLNWCNPPFDECQKWIKKAFEEQQKGSETIMLVPVRTETKYWHDYILFNKNVKIYWLRKGYGFINPDTGESCGVFKNALALVHFTKIHE